MGEVDPLVELGFKTFSLPCSTSLRGDGHLRGMAELFEWIIGEGILRSSDWENIQYTPENIFYVHKVSLLQSRYA